MTAFCSQSARLFSGSVALLMALLTSTVEARDGRDVYEKTCLLCHGLLDHSAWYQLPEDGSEAVLAVITPRGPTLNGIVGRSVANVTNYAYSKGMRKFGETGAIWDRETLDMFLTDSRKFVKGTFMILKLEEEDRKLILDYLEGGIAIYRPSFDSADLAGTSRGLK